MRKTTQIRTKSGHLTSTNKSHIREMLRQGLSCGKINRTTYHIQGPVGGLWTVYVTQRNTETVGGGPVERTDKHTFNLK